MEESIMHAVQYSDDATYYEYYRTSNFQETINNYQKWLSSIKEI